MSGYLKLFGAKQKVWMLENQRAKNEAICNFLIEEIFNSWYMLMGVKNYLGKTRYDL